MPPPTGPEDPNAPGTPAPPPYGAGQPPAGQSPYGQPPAGQSPYGQPAYGQPPAGPGYPVYPPGVPEQPKSKALAITALVLAIIPCLNVAGFVLALVVLIGKKAGKGLAIAALVISLAWAALFVVLLLVSSSLFGTPIDDLESGQCITAKGLTNGEDGVSAIKVVSCNDDHDGEVLATKALDADEAEGYQDLTGGEACGPIVDVEVFTSLPEDVSIIALTQTTDPDEGDHVACVAFNVNGDTLSEKLG